MLFSVTLASSYIALALAVWLGIYLISHGPRNLLSWLTALTLWALGGLFLNIILALSEPPIPKELPVFFRLILPFWSHISPSNNSTAWFQGWSVAPAIGLWHHATVLFRSGGLSIWRNIRIAAGYLVGIAAIAAQSQAEIVTITEGTDPLFLSPLEAGPSFLLFLIFLVIFSIFGLINLVKSANEAKSNFQKKSIQTLIIASLIAGLTGPTMIVSSGLEIRMPILVQTLLLGSATGMIGYSVMRYSSFSGERVIRREFVYHALSAIMMVAAYLGFAWIAVTYFGVSSAAYTIMLIFAIVSFASVDYLRRYLDNFFYKSEARQLKENLKLLSNIASDKDIENQLSFATFSISSLVNASFVVLGTLVDDRIDIVASVKWPLNIARPQFLGKQLRYDDITQFEQEKLSRPFSKVVLLIPLYDSSEQIGALLLGKPENAERFAQQDLERLMHPSDQLARLLSISLTRSKIINQIPNLFEQTDSSDELPGIEERITHNDVEDALRRLYDFSYLGNHKLSDLSIVEARTTEKEITHIDQGKALNKALVDANEKLKPSSDLSGEPPPREWYAYIILSDAYLEEIHNRDIMSRLYISEGTFNRTRRAAVRSVTQALSEMEAHLV